jgi:hypothetical protein
MTQHSHTPAAWAFAPDASARGQHVVRMQFSAAVHPESIARFFRTGDVMLVTRSELRALVSSAVSLALAQGQDAALHPEHWKGAPYEAEAIASAVVRQFLADRPGVPMSWSVTL